MGCGGWSHGWFHNKGTPLHYFSGFFGLTRLSWMVLLLGILAMVASSGGLCSWAVKWSGQRCLLSIGSSSRDANWSHVTSSHGFGHPTTWKLGSKRTHPFVGGEHSKRKLPSPLIFRFRPHVPLLLHAVDYPIGREKRNTF